MARTIHIYDVGDVVYAADEIAFNQVLKVPKGSKGIIKSYGIHYVDEPIYYSTEFDNGVTGSVPGHRLLESPPTVSFWDFRTGVIEVKGITPEQCDRAQEILRAEGTMDEAAIQACAYLDWLKGRVEANMKDPNTPSAMLTWQGERAWPNGKNAIGITLGDGVVQAHVFLSDDDSRTILVIKSRDYNLAVDPRYYDSDDDN